MTEHLCERHGIYYRTNTFEPGRRTLVFVHGVSGSSSAWRQYESRFSPHYNIVTYDLRGHGMSRKYAHFRDYAVDRFIGDFTTLLDGLHIERCTVIAHSFATLLALEILGRRPERVDGAVLISPDYDVGRMRRARLLRAILAPVPLMDHLPFRHGPGAHVDYARFPHSGDWNLRRMTADIGNTTWRVYLYCSRQIYSVHANEILGSIGVPLLLVHGQRDSIFSVENARYMATQIPDARLVVLSDADHIIVLNHPERVAAAIHQFLEGQIANTTAEAGSLRTKPSTQVHEADQQSDGGGVLHDPKSL